MSYILTDGGATIAAYPYSVGMLRQDNKATSFPVNISLQQLAEFNVFPVVETTPPAYDPLTQTLAEVTPTTSDNGATWTQAWEVTNLSAEDAQATYDAAVASALAQVKSLQEQIQTFYTQSMIAGYGFSAEMLAYIAAISDPESLPGYPLISSFPELPTNILDENNPRLPVSIYTMQEMDDKLLPITQELSGVDSMDLLTAFEQSLT